MNSFVIYKSLSNPYARFISLPDLEIADIDNETMTDSPTSWGDTDLQLSRDTDIGGIVVTMPSWLPANEYDVLIYDAATPANTDIPIIGKRVIWNGAGIEGQDNL